MNKNFLEFARLIFCYIRDEIESTNSNWVCIPDDELGDILGKDFFSIDDIQEISSCLEKFGWKILLCFESGFIVCKVESFKLIEEKMNLLELESALVNGVH